MAEQRHFHRIKFAVTTDVEINGAVSEATLVDISLKGALVSLPPGVTADLGSPCQLTIHLNDAEAMLSFSGKVVHLQEGLVGIKITLINLDSMIHLRRLVTLNSENSDQVNSELKALFDFDSEHE